MSLPDPERRASLNQLSRASLRVLLAFLSLLPMVRAQAASSARVAGACVADESAAPLAGLALHWLVLSTPPRETRGTTDAEGRFALELGSPLAEGEPSILSISGSDRATFRRVLTRPRIGQDHDLGVLRLVRGVSLRGTILDAAGAPIPEAAVLIAMDTARCDAEGRFEFAAILPAGTHEAIAQAPGYQVLMQKLRVPEDGEVALVLQRSQSITGRIVDLDARPIAGVTVYADHDRLPRQATSDADGRFELVDTTGSAPDTELHVLAGNSSAWRSGERFAWGTRDVLVKLERALELELEVVDAASGAPVEDYAIHLLQGQRPSAQSLRDGGTHPRGKLRVTRVPRGESKLWIVPQSAELAPIEPITVLAFGARVAPLRVALERRQPLRVEVVDPEGRAIPGVSVALVRAPLARPLHVLDEPQRDAAGLLRSEADRACWIDEQVSDATGHAELRDVPRRGQSFAGAAADRGGVVFPKLHLVAAAPGWARTIVEATRDAEQRLVLQRGGRIEGRVVPASAATALSELFLAGPGSDEQVQYRRVVSPPRLFAVDAEGRFAIDNLTPSAYRLYGVIAGKARPFALTSCRVEEGATAPVTIDLADQVPGTLSVRVAHLPPAAKLQIRRVETQDGKRRKSSVPHPELDATGRLAPLALVPGTYELSLWFADPSARNPELATYFLREVELASGDALELELAYRTRRLEVIVRSADLALPEQPLQSRAIAGAEQLEPRWEGERLIFDPAPKSPFHLVIDGRRYPPAGLCYEVPSGEQPWTIEVQLKR
jgi:hypothetical protein